MAQYARGYAAYVNHRILQKSQNVKVFHDIHIPVEYISKYTEILECWFILDSYFHVSLAESTLTAISDFLNARIAAPRIICINHVIDRLRSLTRLATSVCQATGLQLTARNQNNMDSNLYY